MSLSHSLYMYRAVMVCFMAQCSADVERVFPEEITEARGGSVGGALPLAPSESCEGIYI